MGFWDRVATVFGARRNTQYVGARIVTEPSLLEAYWRIGGNLTPEGVSNILRLADTGEVWQLVDLGNESRRKDTHMQSVLATRELAIAALPIKVIEPEEPSAQELEAVDLCKRTIDAPGGIDDQVGFAPLVAHMQRGVYFGYSVGETDWQIERGRLVPRGWWQVPHRLFAFDHVDGRLKWSPLTVRGLRQGYTDLLREFPARFVQHQPRTNGDVAAREGLIHVLTWAALFRNWTLRDWLMLAELSWKPWRVATHENHDKEIVDTLKAAIRSLTTSGGAVLPAGAKIEVFWPGGTSSPAGRGNHGELFDVLGKGMSKAVLGHELAIDSASRGTKEQGQGANWVRQDIKEWDALSVAATLRRDLFTPLVRLNFGENVRVPVVVPVASEEIDRLAFAEAIGELKKAGLRIPARWVRGEFGMPEPGDDEEVLEVEVPVAPDGGPGEEAV